MNDVDVLVIGGGVTGLVAAYTLARLGFGVALVEKCDDVGGLMQSLTIDGVTLDRLYHHLFVHDHAALCLIDELGLSDRLLWAHPQNAAFVNGTLHPLTTPLDLMRFRPLSIVDRLRTGLTIQAARLRHSWTSLEAITAADYLKARVGIKAYTTFWAPLLRSKFGDDADTVSAVWMWNKVKQRGGSRSRGGHDERLGSLRGGFTMMLEALKDALVAPSGRTRAVALYTTCQAHAVHAVDSHFRITTSRGDITAQHVVAAVATPVAAALAEPLVLGAYRERLLSTRYKANLCALVKAPVRLMPAYWTTICDPLSFVVAVEQTNAFPVTGSDHWLYLSRYLDERDALWRASDEVVSDAFRLDLARLTPTASTATVVHLERSRYAQPVVTTAYSRKRASITTPVPGFYVAGMAQIYPEDRGLNQAIALGRHVARILIEHV